MLLAIWSNDSIFSSLKYSIRWLKLHYAVPKLADISKKKDGSESVLFSQTPGHVD